MNASRPPMRAPARPPANVAGELEASHSGHAAHAGRPRRTSGAPVFLNALAELLAGRQREAPDGWAGRFLGRAASRRYRHERELEDAGYPLELGGEG